MIVVRRFVASALAAALGVALSKAALAQVPNDSNQVFLGQTGDTNTIRIDQTGIANLVGAEDARLRLNQFGRDNSVEIDQFGLSNAVGAVLRDLGGETDATAQGINQAGSRNRLAIEQTSGTVGGGNAVGRILQIAPDLGSLGRAVVANLLSIVQTGLGGPGEHRIGEVLQRNDTSDGAANEAAITQSGGGAGLGNSLGSLRQSGAGNLFGSVQNDTVNAIGSAFQSGRGNGATVMQGGGTANAIRFQEQRGDFNRLNLRQAGERNFLDIVSQNNAGVDISGNALTVTLSGDDNGGDGAGGLGQFTGIAGDIGVLQASILQIGDDNDLSYTVTGAVSTGMSSSLLALDSVGNLFGFFQAGDGNGLIGVVSGTGNEAAVLQEGDDNEVSFDQSGVENEIASLQEGERNRADVEQAGEGNRATLLVRGDDTNGLFDSFRDAALIEVGLEPGDVRQFGEDNLVDLDVGGTFNLFAVLQSGVGNALTGTILGSGNQAALSQTGDDNIIAFTQTGSNNSLAIEQ